jgi:hypothetical protein
MKATIDKDKLLSLQPQTAAAASSNVQPDPTLVSLISSQIMTMQKQMERGFGLMCDKINLIEGRVEGASQ